MITVLNLMTEVDDENLLKKRIHSFDNRKKREEKEGDGKPNTNTCILATTIE